MKKLLFIISSLLFSVVLSAQVQTIGIGSSPNDGTGDNLRTAFGKVNTNNAFIDGRIDTLHVSNTIRASKSGVYSTVQSAINAASAYNVVMVHPGRYLESVDINSNLDLIAEGDVTLTSLKIIGGDTVKVKGFKILPTSTYDTLLYINTSGVAIIDKLHIENSTNTNPVVFIDGGTVWGTDINIKSNTGPDKIVLKGDNIHLQGEYLYASAPQISNDANVYLNYKRMACAWNVENTSYLQAKFGMLRGFDLTDYSDSIAVWFFTISDSAEMNFQCDNLNMPITTESAGEVRIYNTFGDQGRLHFAQNGTGDLYITNSTILYKSSSAVSHIIESAAGNTGTFYSSNNLYDWVCDTEGYTGGGCPIWRTNGNFYSTNDTWYDHGSDTGYDQIGSFGDSVRVEIHGSKFIYTGSYATQEGLVFVDDDDPLHINLTDVTIDVPGDALVFGGGLTSADSIIINNVVTPRGDLFNSGANYRTALITDSPASALTNTILFGDKIQYSPLPTQIKTNSFLQWSSDTVRMTKNGDAGDSITITLTFANSTTKSISSADFKIHIKSTNTYLDAAIYDVSFDGWGAMNGTDDLTVTKVLYVDDGTDWVSPVVGDIKRVSPNSYGTYKIAIVNKSLTYDSIVQLQAFNCIGISSITVQAE